MNSISSTNVYNPQKNILRGERVHIHPLYLSTAANHLGLGYKFKEVTFKLKCNLREILFLF